MMKPLLLGFSSLLLVGACAGDGSETPSKDDIRAQGKTDDGHDWCGELGWYGDRSLRRLLHAARPDCATDAREPELADARDILQSTITMTQGLAQAAQAGPDHRGEVRARQRWQALAQHVSGRQVALARLRAQHVPGARRRCRQQRRSRLRSRRSTTSSTSPLVARPDVAAASAHTGSRSSCAEVENDCAHVYWAIPTIQEGRAGYGVWGSTTTTACIASSTARAATAADARSRHRPRRGRDRRARARARQRPHRRAPVEDQDVDRARRRLLKTLSAR